MKTLYLHIGTPKTATTAIQYFCADNEKTLNAHGYTYPDFGLRYLYTGWRRNAHFLIGDVRSGTERQDFTKEDQIVDECFEKIYQLFEQFDNIILSDEGLWRQGVQNKCRIWKRIREELDKGLLRVKIIVYLRRQDEFAYSRWNQHLKAARGPASPAYVRNWEDYLDTLPMAQFHYYTMLKRIAGYVGKENIIVRQFEKGCFYKNSIYADFLQAVGLPYTNEYVVLENPEINLKLSKNNLEIKRILNGLPELDESSNDLFRDCLSVLSEDDTEDHKLSMFSEEEMWEFMSLFEEGNRRIAREYLNSQEDLFQLSYAAEGKWTPDSLSTFEDAIRFSGTTTIHMLQRIKKLEEQLNQQQAEKQKNPLKRLKRICKRIFKKLKRLLKKPEPAISEQLNKDCALQ